MRRFPLYLPQDTSGKYFGAIVGSIVLGLVTELVRSNGACVRGRSVLPAGGLWALFGGRLVGQRDQASIHSFG